MYVYNTATEILHLCRSRTTSSVQFLIWIFHLEQSLSFKNERFKIFVHVVPQRHVEGLKLLVPRIFLCCFLKKTKKSYRFISQEPNFIRCVKSNDFQQSDFFDESFVKAQLQNTGTAYLIENSDNVKIRE